MEGKLLLPPLLLLGPGEPLDVGNSTLRFLPIGELGALMDDPANLPISFLTVPDLGVGLLCSSTETSTLSSSSVVLLLFCTCGTAMVVAEFVLNRAIISKPFSYLVEGFVNSTDKVKIHPEIDLPPGCCVCELIVDASLAQGKTRPLLRGGRRPSLPHLSALCNGDR